MRYAILFLVVFLSACSGESESGLNGSGGSDAGTTGGSAGKAGSAGASGNAGTGGHSGGAGTAGTGGQSGSAGQGGIAGTAGAAGAAGKAGAGGAGGAATCTNCDHSCCGNRCINLDNDINNCGKCGNKCQGNKPFCDNGHCKDKAPCEGGTKCGAVETCCGKKCCTSEQICCRVPGPVIGPDGNLGCVKPVDGTCPRGCKTCVCNAPDTQIATPSGNRDISDLRQGDWVYSVHQGKVTPVRISRTHSVPSPNHFVMRVRLATGQVLRISPRHPTTDGRTFGDLRAGQRLDGVAIESVELIAYEESHTYDILPESDTGAYFAGGVLIASTLTGTPEHALPLTAPYSSAPAAH